MIALRQPLLSLLGVLALTGMMREPEVCNWYANGCYFTTLEEHGQWDMAVNCGQGITIISGTGDIQDPCDEPTRV